MNNPQILTKNDYIINVRDGHYIIRYEDSIDINIASLLPDHQSLINHEYKFVYQPLTKVACKTIKTWMLSLSNETDMVNRLKELGSKKFGYFLEAEHSKTKFNIHNAAIENFGTATRGEEHIYFDEKITSPDYLKFMFVRNPWTRIVSTYLEKFRNPSGFIYKKAIDMNNRFRQTIKDKHVKDFFDDDDILSFEGFVHILFCLSKKSYNNFDVHWMPQYIIQDLYMQKPDFIGKIENFNKDFNKILKQLGIKIKPEYNIGSNSHNFWKPIEFYKNNDDLIYKVSEIYKEDIKRYDYKFIDLEK